MDPNMDAKHPNMDAKQAPTKKRPAAENDKEKKKTEPRLKRIRAGRATISKPPETASKKKTSLVERVLHKKSAGGANSLLRCVADLSFPRANSNLRTIEAESTLVDALSTLREWKISSAPVVETTLEGVSAPPSSGAAAAEGDGADEGSVAKRRRFLGFVDLVDLTHAIVDVLDETDAEWKQEDNVIAQSGGDGDDAGEGEDMLSDIKMGNLAAVSAQSVSDYSRHDPSAVLFEDNSILDAVRMLAVHHRVAVHTRAGVFTGVLTQSQLLETLLEEFPSLSRECSHAALVSHVDYLRASVEMPTQSLPSNPTPLTVAPPRVYSVTAGTPAIDAFRELQAKHVTALAVVSLDGVLVDALSASDVNVFSEFLVGGGMLRFSNLEALQKPVEQYLAESRQSGSSGMVDFRTLVQAVPDDRLADVATNMLMHGVHRAFVVNDRGEPTGVVTSGDVLALWLMKPRDAESGAHAVGKVEKP